MQMTGTVFLPLVLGGNPPRNSKRGVVNLSGCADVDTVDAAWTYVYGPEPILCPDTECVPMIRDAATMQDHVGGNSEYILGFNEPNAQEPQGCNLLVGDASFLWAQMEAWYPDKKLVAPVPSSAASYDTGGWVHRFREAYQDWFDCWPRLDALALHLYFASADGALAVLQDARSHAWEWGIPQVWVTEMGMPWSDPTPEALLELRTVLDWMNDEPVVARYAWFGTRITLPDPAYPPSWKDLSLVRVDGSLTEWGMEYAR